LDDHAQKATTAALLSHIVRWVYRVGQKNKLLYFFHIFDRY